MDGQKNLSRFLFFYNLYCKTQQEIDIPFGFKLQAFLYDLLNLGASGDLRRQIFNEVQHQMVFLPALDAFQQKIIHNQDNKPYDESKKDAMIAYFNFFNKDYMDHVELSRGLLTYLLPDFNKSKIAMLLPIPPYTPEFCLQERADYMFDQKSKQTIAILWESFKKSWSDEDIYPYSLFQRCRSVLYLLHDGINSYDQFGKYSKKDH